MVHNGWEIIDLLGLTDYCSNNDYFAENIQYDKHPCR